MNRTILWILLLLATIWGCDKKKGTVDNNLKIFKVEGSKSKFDIELSLPKTFVSVWDMDEDKQMDTMDIELNWILDIQFEDQDAFCFFDSLDKRINIYVKSGPRVDISDKERNITYFSVPTVPLDKVFPQATADTEIVIDSGEKKYQEKTYYKRRYKPVPDNGYFSEFYYVSTKWQSTLFIIRSKTERDFEDWILNYKVVPK